MPATPGWIVFESDEGLDQLVFDAINALLSKTSLPNQFSRALSQMCSTGLSSGL